MRSIPVLLALACKPHPPLEPVYDCTQLTTVQQQDMQTLLDACENWECERKAMQLYCEEISREER